MILGATLVPEQEAAVWGAGSKVLGLPSTFPVFVACGFHPFAPPELRRIQM